MSQVCPFQDSISVIKKDQRENGIWVWEWQAAEKEDAAGLERACIPHWMQQGSFYF